MKEFRKSRLNDTKMMKYDSFTLRVPAGELEKVKIAAQENGETINGYINRLLAANIAGFVPVDKPPIPTTIDKIEDEETQQDVRNSMVEPICEPDGISVAELAEKIGCGMTRRSLFVTLRSDGYLFSGGCRHNLPTQSADGLISVKQSILSHPDGSYRICKTPIITQNGIEYFTKLYKKSPQ